MLHKIQPLHRPRRSRRIGRGGKRGTYSGRGQKGQKSRAGANIRPAEREFIIRLPKRRGFKNLPRTPRPYILNVGDLDVSFNSGARVTIAEVARLGLVRFKKSVELPTKILGSGNLTKALNIKGFLVSKAAKNKILKAGGTVR